MEGRSIERLLGPRGTFLRSPPGQVSGRFSMQRSTVSIFSLFTVLSYFKASSTTVLITLDMMADD